MTRISIILLSFITIITIAACDKPKVNNATNQQPWERNQAQNDVNTTPSMTLLDSNNNPIETGFDLYATTGFDGNVAFVAQCTQRDEANQCTETTIALMDQQGRLLNGFGEYYYPELITYNSSPALLINIAPDGVYRLYPTQETLVTIPEAGTKSVIFSDDRFLIENNNLLGYINKNGQLAILPSFIAAQPFVDGKAQVIDKNGLLGTITPEGMFYPEKYACIMNYNDEYKLELESKPTKVPNENHYKYVNIGGKLARISDDVRVNAKTFYFSTAYQQSESSEFCIGGKWGILDKDNKLVIPAEYENIKIGKFFHLGQNETGKYALIDMSGQRISEFIYDDVRVISDDNNIIQSMYLVARLGDKWGMVNATNQITIPFEYEELGPESEDFIAFRKNTKWGFIDLSGKEVFAPIYTEVKPFSSGRSEAILEGAPTNLYRDESIREVWLERERIMNK